MSIKRAVALATAGILLLLAGDTASYAQGGNVDPIVPGLHNSGVDDDNKKLKQGEPDFHFAVISGPLTGTPTVIGPNDIPDGWISRQDRSLWISIAEDTFAPAGTYVYRMEIDLSGFDPDSLILDAKWGVDDPGAEILLNGNATGIVNSVGPGEYSEFRISSGFTPGINTLDFVVPNRDNSSAAGRSKPGGGGGGDSSLATGLRLQIEAVTVDAADLDLAIDKSHAEVFTPGSTGVYTLAVSNVGAVDADSEVVVTDTLPQGLAPIEAAGSGWSCTIAGQDVQCARADALAAGASYPPIDITVRVAADASSVTNVGRVDIEGDTNLSNNESEDPTTIIQLVDLAIDKSHSQTFEQGKTGIWTIVVSNVGASPSNGTVTVADDVPSGFTPLDASGNGWSCSIAGQSVTCSRADSLAPGNAYPPISLAVAVAEDATTTSNTAVVSGGGDGNEDNNTDTDLTPVEEAVRDLAIAKSHSGDFTAGDTGRTFTIEVANVGDVASAGTVTVRDELPGGLTPTAAGGSGWSCSISGALVTCSRADALVAGASYPLITITVDVADDATSTVNIASVEGGGDQDDVNNEVRDPVYIAPLPDPADLTIRKRHRGSFTQGGTGQYNIEVTNVGGSPSAGQVTVTDTLPAGFTPTSAAGPGWSCAISAQTVTCTRADGLAAGAAYPAITLVVAVADDASTATNTATVAGGGDANDGNNSDSDPTDVIVPRRDLTISKSHAEPFPAGGTGTFTVTVSNVGDGNSVGTVTVTDTVPVGLTPTSATGSGWTCDTTGRAVSCSRDDALAPGASYPPITLVVAVADDATSDVNNASVSGGGDQDDVNNSAADPYVVLPSVPSPVPDLTIAKSHPAPVEQGQDDLPFTLVVSNAGGGPTNGTVTVTDSFPQGFTPTDASGPGWDCDESGSTVTCTRSDVLAGGVSWPAITVLTDVADDATSRVNSARVDGGGDASPANGVAYDPIVVAVTATDLAISKSHTGAFVQGQQGQFAIDVDNVGTRPSEGEVTVTDVFPAGLAPISASGPGWSCDIDDATVECRRDDVLAGGGSWPTITVVVDVADDAVDTVNTATVSGGGDDAPGNNTASDAVTIIGGGPEDFVDLTVAKTHSGGVEQGQTGVPFTVSVSNVGSAASAGTVTVIDPFPAGLTPSSATGPGWSCTIGGATVTCSRDDSLAAGASYPPVTIAVDVGADATSTVNEVTVSGGNDANGTNNSARDPVTIGTTNPDLTIDKQHTGVLQQGQRHEFFIDVSNVGTAPTSGTVTVADAVPAGLTPSDAAGNGWTCTLTGQQATCSRGDALAAGSAYPTITLGVDVLGTASSGTNVATVSGGGDNTPGNNTASDAFAVGGSPDLTISKSHHGDFHRGQTGAQYTIVVRNTGTAPTSGSVTVDDLVPVGLAARSAAGNGWSCQVNGPAVACDRSDALVAQSSWPAITLTVDVANDAEDLVNTATVSGGGDTTPDNNTASDPTRIITGPQLTITKTHPTPVLQGQAVLPFTISVGNNGDAVTQGEVTVSDEIPAGLTPVSVIADGWDCAVSGATGTCSRQDKLAAGAVYPPIVFNVAVADDAVTVINVAEVSGGGDNTPEDNVTSDRVVISRAGVPNLVIDKSHEDPFYQGQSGATFSIEVSNAGEAASSGTVTVGDTLPGSLTPTAAAGDGWICSIAAPDVSCSRGDSLLAGGVWPLITLSVDVAANAPSSLTNTATVEGGGDDTPADNSDSDVVFINTSAPDLTVDKSHNDPFDVGQPDATYRIEVSNVGSAPSAGEVRVVDRLPAGFRPAEADGAGWDCRIGAQTVTCRRSDSLPPGTSFPAISLRVDVLPGATNGTNVVVVGGGGDGNPDNNIDQDPTTVGGAAPDLTISMAPLSDVVAGGETDYSATVENIGSGRSVGPVLVISRLSETVSPLVALGAGWTCNEEGRQFRCATSASVNPAEELPPLRFRVHISANPAPELFATGTVLSAVDSNPDNNDDELRTTIDPPQGDLVINQVALPAVTEIGGSARFVIGVRNRGSGRVASVLVEDVLPRGFHLVEGSAVHVSSLNRTDLTRPGPTLLRQTETGLEWRLGSLEPGELVLLEFRTVVGADAVTGAHEALASTVGNGPDGDSVEAGPAAAVVRVIDGAFSMQQVVVGRVFEDADGDGEFGDGDRGVAGARVITSSGQAVITDANGLYNLPSIGAGSVALSLDPGTVPEGLALAGDGPGGGSWSRLLRTPIGGGALLRQDFRLARRADGGPEPAATGAPAAATDAAVSSAAATQSVASPLSEIDRIWPNQRRNVTGGATPDMPPRRDYETRQGPAMMIGFGEVVFGDAAPEFELFDESGDTWGFASLFYQGVFFSEDNRLTLSYDSRRNLNSTTGADRLFELDALDRVYPITGDTSTRQELAQSNSDLFVRFDRGNSYVTWGDLLGDLPESNSGSGRMAAYSRHVTGLEVRIGSEKNFVAVRGANPDTSFASDVFSGSSYGVARLSHGNILPGSETVAVEVRDRRAPERLLTRRVLARNVDYRLDPFSGALTFLGEIGGLDGDLNLVQAVATYEYYGGGADNMVYSGRAAGTIGAFTIGGSFFTEEPGGRDRFSVAGLELAVALPNGGSLSVDVPYSYGSPDVIQTYDHTVGTTSEADGLAVGAELEQPLGDGIAVRASFLHADADFSNPFAGTTEPGARYGRAELDLEPFDSARLLLGFTNQRNDTERVDNQRNTVSAAWTQRLARKLFLTGGYDYRKLDDYRDDAETVSGLLTGEARLDLSRLEAMVRREQNVAGADDPTYPTQTVLGARFRLTDSTSLVYSHRLSDKAIVPIGDLSGFSRLDSKSEFRVGMESRLRNGARLTSRYQVEDGINGADAFAVIGAQNRFDVGAGFALDLGIEHGQAVEGKDNDFTTGVVGLAWLEPDTFKANARYEMRDRDGFSGLFSGGAAGRIVGGLTGLVRGQWLDDDRRRGLRGFDVLAGLALRPAGSDAVGLLFSYRLNDTTRPNPLLPVAALDRREQRLSTDAYWRPLGWLELYGKGGWRRLDMAVGSLTTDTYLGQGRVQIHPHRLVDLAIEQRWLHQPVTDSTRNTVAAELGFWPFADLRLGVGYNFKDTTDPYGRDEQGRPKGAYFTISTKLANLFDLLGSTPAPVIGKR